MRAAPPDGSVVAHRTAPDHATTVAGLGRHLAARRDDLVDQAIAIAKARGYARYTTTIRAAWTEAVDSITESLIAVLADPATTADGPDATTDYLRDHRFARMRAVARRHRALGITLQLYIGLLKHFRNIYQEATATRPDTGPGLGAAVTGFFDAAELAVGADWAEATGDDRLTELQARVRSVALDKDRYVSVFESLRDPAFLLDRADGLVTANQAAAARFVGAADAGALTYLRAMRGRITALEAVLAPVRAALAAGRQTVALDTRCGRGWFDIRARAIHDAVGTLALGRVVILHDVTAHRAAAEDARRAERAMSTVLAAMSHEIRTPLHGVVGATELLRRAPLARQGLYVDAIESAGRTLLRTLDGVLDYARLEARPPGSAAQEQDLAAVLDDYFRVAAVLGQVRGVPVRWSIGGTLPRRAAFDWPLTQQVLTNLTSNALRHDGGAGIDITVRRCRVGGGTGLRFTVSDHGPGIAPDRVHTLFHPDGSHPVTTEGDGSRTDGGRTAPDRTAPDRTDGGAGLGLAIARRLVAAMGGRIGCRNRRRGALFWFETPYRRGSRRAPPRPAAPVAASAGTAPGQVPPLHCLLVEDDPVSRLVTGDRLRRLGAAVTEAASAAAALRQARADRFDLFVLDHHLPDTDGAVLAGALRADDLVAPAARIVALTANADLAARRGDGPAPFDRVLAKPVTGAALQAALQALLPAAGAAPALEDMPPATRLAMATAFTACCGERTDRLLSALRAGHRTTIADQAHRLAGSCAVIGLTDLAAVLRQLEDSSRSAAPGFDTAAWHDRLRGPLAAAPEAAHRLATQHPGQPRRSAGDGG